MERFYRNCIIILAHTASFHKYFVTNEPMCPDQNYIYLQNWCGRKNDYTNKCIQMFAQRTLMFVYIKQDIRLADRVYHIEWEWTESTFSETNCNHQGMYQPTYYCPKAPCWELGSRTKGVFLLSLHCLLPGLKPRISPFLH